MKSNIAVVGLGSMGKNHVRVLHDIPDINLVAVADVDSDLVSKVSTQYSATGYQDYKDLIANESLDGLVIAVPTSHHYAVAKYALNQKINILIEKPICKSVSEAEDLIDLAKMQGALLLVGHIERYNPAIIDLKNKLNQGQLGKIFTIYSRRASPLPTRIQDVGVGMDLAIHELDIMRYITDSEVIDIQSNTLYVTGSDHEDTIFSLLKFSNDTLGICDVNWITPTKARTLSVTGEKGMFVVDYLAQDLMFYENPGSVNEIEGSWDFTVKAGNMTKYEVNRKEPLRSELESFANACKHNDKKYFATDGQDGLEALKLTIQVLEKGKQ
jgi:UDP-N-acetylglucosamine 3-dehydrogenase